MRVHRIPARQAQPILTVSLDTILMMRLWSFSACELSRYKPPPSAPCADGRSVPLALPRVGPDLMWCHFTAPSCRRGCTAATPAVLELER